ncbi:hypothetical protein ACH4U3_44265 [Streptomyces griseoruber]
MTRLFLRNKGHRGHHQRMKTAIAPLRREPPLGRPRKRPASPR